jgi:hypothetical protein
MRTYADQSWQTNSTRGGGIRPAQQPTRQHGWLSAPPRAKLLDWRQLISEIESEECGGVKTNLLSSDAVFMVYLKTEPSVDGFRGDPRFQHLLKLIAACAERIRDVDVHSLLIQDAFIQRREISRNGKAIARCPATSNGTGFPQAEFESNRAANITRENSVILPKGGVLMLLRLVFLATVTLSGQLVFAQDIKTVLVASRRAGYLELYDPASLQTIGRVAASPDGHRLFIAQAKPILYALSAASMGPRRLRAVAAIPRAV